MFWITIYSVPPLWSHAESVLNQHWSQPVYFAKNWGVLNLSWISIEAYFSIFASKYWDTESVMNQRWIKPLFSTTYWSHTWGILKGYEYSNYSVLIVSTGNAPSSFGNFVIIGSAHRRYRCLLSSAKDTTPSIQMSFSLFTLRGTPFVQCSALPLLTP